MLRPAGSGPGGAAAQRRRKQTVAALTRQVELFDAVLTRTAEQTSIIGL